jgi:hypothetical protein
MGDLSACFNIVLIGKTIILITSLSGMLVHSQAMQEKVLKKTTPMFFFVLTPDIVPCPAITFCCSKDWRKPYQSSRDRNIICFEEREQPASIKSCSLVTVAWMSRN